MKKVGKKNVFLRGRVTALFAAVGLLFVSCNSELLESADVGESSGSKYGSVTLVPSSVGKALNVSELAVKSVKVYGYETDVVSGTVSEVAGGKGSASIEKIPVGRRVIEVVSNKTGATLYAVKDIVAGNNTVSVDWSTTAVGKVYFELLQSQEIKDIDSSAFSSAIPDSVHPSLVDASSIAKDYLSGKLKSSSEYVLSSGSVVATVYGYSGKTLQIADPSSKVVTASADGKTVTFSDVYPGTWNVYADGKKVSSIKVVSGENTIQIGHQGYRVHLINASSWGTSAPKIYAYSKSNESNNNGWNTVEMEGNSEDWNFDLTYDWFSADDTLVIFFSTDTNRYPADQQPGLSLPSDVTEAWYDLTKKEWLKTNPFENKLSSDATLSSLMVNGQKISGFASSITSYTAEVSSSTKNVTVYAETNDSNATFSVSPAGLTEIEEGASKDFTVLVTAEDGTTKTYSVKVVRKEAVVDDVSLSSVKVNGSSAIISGTDITFKNSGAEDSFAVTSIVATPTDTNANVTYSATTGTVSDGCPSTFTITVKNGSKTATYTLTVSYTKKEQGNLNSVYSTNATGYGVNKTISSFADWDSSMIIAQGAANDDPRAFRGYHEKATDFYALYAAYDDENLYLMVEMPSIDDRDIISKDWQYALDENMGMGVAINTGKRVPGDGEMDKGMTPWNAAGKFYSIEEGIDTLLMFHPAEYGTPGFFITNSDGKFSYDKDYCLTFTSQGVETSKQIGLCSKTMYGRTDNYNLSKEAYLAKDDFEDFFVNKDKKDILTGYMYQITISLKGLGIDKNYLETNGIGVMTFSTFGTSMMDALPWCSNLIDNAAEAYSHDDSTSKEKEDVDIYDVPLARIGHAK